MDTENNSQDIKMVPKAEVIVMPTLRNMIKCGDCEYFIITQHKLGHGECRENSVTVKGFPVTTITNCCGRGRHIDVYEEAPGVIPVQRVEITNLSDIKLPELNLKAVESVVKGLATEATQLEGVTRLKKLQELMEEAPSFDNPEDWK